MGRPKFRKTGCKHVTRNKLLPLAASMVRATSLQNHLALEALRSRYGASLHVTLLFRTVYLTYLLRDTIDQGCDLDVFQDAESALYQCSLRADEDGSWQLAEADIDALKIVLTVHDWQLQLAPAHVYESACAHLLEYLINGEKTVIPASSGDAMVWKV
ncbi:hypothetical protein [Paraburkholderia silvatlantica]|uniref:Fis family transcriptional regulator n=1 Tax=Paraburkholderia silvatlantica TaxID=321895 RepID=A0A2U0Z9C6_9BURK|nr:hypothetical protein [Paraburkholderia silvatlantica]MBB2928211.1 hypothetical protein [Paraburkholderia silvatlantica]PVY15513.1 hypothetical protein C7411_1566 [Paraburkholderia silvatlantica]PXW23013.1 hypothetical protein C7413_1606 [Paraburkholderia silvatlantica]PYE12155.1 hypothetical protein C7410_1622 [Paraburkholderia silvatlantica]TDQ72055.1 hypothetical protein C7412_1552 [Paraburkholderia silvatlantica]